MSFPEQRFSKFSRNLLTNVKEHLLQNYLFSHIIGLEEEALKSMYVDSFQTEFPEYMNDEISDKLKFSGKNLSYALYAYISMNRDIEVNLIINFAKTLIRHQLNNFLFDFDLPEWCDEYFENDYEKENEDENDQKEQKEQKEQKDQKKDQIPDNLMIRQIGLFNSAHYKN